jgi:hypothetical protein
MPMWEGDDGSRDGKGPTPKQRYEIKPVLYSHDVFFFFLSLSIVIFFIAINLHTYMHNLASPYYVLCVFNRHQ